MLIEDIFDDPKTTTQKKHDFLKTQYFQLADQLRTFENLRQNEITIADRKGHIRGKKHFAVPPEEWTRMDKVGNRKVFWVYKDTPNFDKIMKMTNYAKKLFKRIGRVNKNLHALDGPSVYYE